MDVNMNEYDTETGICSGCGLLNVGNTCFLNSCMQILFHTKELTDILDGINNKKITLNKKIDTILLLEWNNLQKLISRQTDNKKPVNPRRFVDAVQRVARKKDMDLFAGYEQNDLPEFFIFIIDCFHNSIAREIKMEINGDVKTELDMLALKCYESVINNYSKEYSEIWKMFYAIQITQLISVKTDKVISIIPEPYLILNLPIPYARTGESVNLYQCFDLYIESEILYGDNAIYNEETKEKEEAEKISIFWSFPPILVVDIKRFNSTNSKNKVLVDFPLDNLDLTKYVIGYNKMSYIYELYGVCNHMGNLNGGHYTAFVKNSLGVWHHYDDETVTEITDLTQIVNNNAYCFFYRKKKQTV